MQDQRTTDPLVTKEGIVVKVGQVWQDLDKRMHGRRVKVVGVFPEQGRVQVRNVNYDKLTVLSVRRMYRHSTGWGLVSNA